MVLRIHTSINRGRRLLLRSLLSFSTTCFDHHSSLGNTFTSFISESPCNSDELIHLMRTSLNIFLEQVNSLLPETYQSLLGLDTTDLQRINVRQPLMCSSVFFLGLDQNMLIILDQGCEVIIAPRLCVVRVVSDVAFNRFDILASLGYRSDMHDSTFYIAIKTPRK